VRRRTVLHSPVRAENQREPAKIVERVGILVEVAEHVIVFGAEIVVAAVFGEDERIEKQPVGIVGGFSEERAAGAR